MSINQCLEIAISGQEISREQADELRSLYDRYVAEFALAYGPPEARRMAQETLARRLEAEATQRKRAALLQLESIQRVERFVFGYRNARGETDPALALKRLISNHGETETGTSSIDGRSKAILAGVHADLEAMLHEHRRSFLTGQPIGKARIENIVRETLGQATGDEAAKRFSEAVQLVFERLRQRYNSSGGAIGKLDGGYLPQRHDGRSMMKAGYDTWRDFINGRLDWDRMRHHLTGDPILPGERDEILRWVFDTVTSDGWAHTDPTMTPKGRGALVRQHAESRFLHFKDADAWIAYQKKFGEPNTFAAIMGHVKVMARDIATMEILGPNPEATLNWLSQAIEKEAAEAARGMPARFATRTELIGKRLRDPKSYARQQIHVARRMYDIVRGSAATPVNGPAADIAMASRNVVTASSLQSAMLSAVSDPIFGVMARRFATGMRSGFLMAGDIANVLIDTVGALRTEDRRAAVRADLINDSMLHVMGEQSRYAASLQGPAAWMADRVLVWQGLSGWTQAGRHGFGLHMQGQFADNIASPWDQLQPQLRRSLQRYGIDGIDWAVMQRARTWDLSADNVGVASVTGGANILRPREIQALADQPVDSLLGVIVTDQTRLAARQFINELEAVRGGARMSMAQIIDRAEAFGRPELRDMIMRFTLGSMDEVRDFLGRLVAERRFEAGSPVSDSVDQKTRRYLRTLGERYAEMILQETDFAVPQGTIHSRAIMMGEGKPGTIGGELTRYFTQFKSFGVAVWQLHVHRMVREWVAGHRVGSAGYASGVLLGSTLLGALGVQLKGYRDGKDAQDMTRADFWVRAMAQGGGWGIWGDFMLADTNRFGGSWAQTLAGPTVGRLENLWNLTAGNVRELATNKKTNAGRELVKFLDANTPFVGIWYVKMAWQRTVLDQMQKALDPEASAAFRRRQAYAKKQGTDYWWAPGDTAPRRGPSLIGSGIARAR